MGTHARQGRAPHTPSRTLHYNKRHTCRRPTHAVVRSAALRMLCNQHCTSASTPHHKTAWPAGTRLLGGTGHKHTSRFCLQKQQHGRAAAASRHHTIRQPPHTRSAVRRPKKPPSVRWQGCAAGRKALLFCVPPSYARAQQNTLYVQIHALKEGLAKGLVPSQTPLLLATFSAIHTVHSPASKAVCWPHETVVCFRSSKHITGGSMELRSATSNKEQTIAEKQGRRGTHVLVQRLTAERRESIISAASVSLTLSPPAAAAAADAFACAASAANMSCATLLA